MKPRAKDRGFCCRTEGTNAAENPQTTSSGVGARISSLKDQKKKGGLRGYGQLNKIKILFNIGEGQAAQKPFSGLLWTAGCSGATCAFSVITRI